MTRDRIAPVRIAPVRIAVVGAGLIGQRHIEEIAASEAAELASIVDPAPVGAELAHKYGVHVHRSFADLVTADRPDGVVLATPNTMHVDGGLGCVAAGLPVLVEKPLADTVEGALRLAEAGEAADVPVLTGHHRNHSPIMAEARRVVASGVLGRIVAVTGTALFRKPGDYFTGAGEWRRRPGGGPVLLNLTHDVNNLLSLAGDVVSVQAVTSSAARGFEVEDTAAIVLTFASGALGTFLLSDAAASPRSWEQTSGENTAYAAYPDETCYHLAGTLGSLSIPTMRLLVCGDEPSWYEPMTSADRPLERSDPLANQIAHFAAVIRGEEHPVCSARDGLATMRVVEAVAESARTGRPVGLSLG